MSSTHRHLLLDFFWQVISGPPCIPPMLIFKRKRYAPELAIGAPSGGLVEISDTGYSNSELFLKWLKHFNTVVQPGPDKEE
jgi:hypothetical protein